MIKLVFKNGLLFTTIKIKYQGKSKEINNIVIDTGAAETIITPDIVEDIGLVADSEDTINAFYGAGGSLHSFFIKRIDEVTIGEIILPEFKMDFGLVDPKGAINGLLGLDVLIKIGAIIDIKNMELRVS